MTFNNKYSAGIFTALLTSLLFSAQVVAQTTTTLTATRSSSFTYNAQGLLLTETIEPDSPQSCLVTTYGYDSYGNKTSISTQPCAGATGSSIASATVARTATASYAAQTVVVSGVSYSTPAGYFATSNANALLQAESKEYDPRFGGITKLVGPNGLATLWTYDTFARKTRETRADGTYTTWAYNLCTDAGVSCPAPIAGQTLVNQLVEASFTSSGVSLSPAKIQYTDALGRAVRSQTLGFAAAGATPPTLVQDKEHNALGQLVRSSNSYNLATPSAAVWTTYTYDTLDRLLSASVPDAAAVAFSTTVDGATCSGIAGTATSCMSYNGLSTVSTNSKGQSKTTTKNAFGQVAIVSDTQNNTVYYRYDALGQLLQTNAAGQVAGAAATGSITTLTYNQRGQKIGMVDPAMGAWDYAYNVYGELVSQTDSLAKVTTMSYDVLGRMTNRTEPDLVSDWKFDTTFAGAACGKSIGKLCEAKAGNGYNRKHTYDTLGRATVTATVLDSASTPASISVAYNASTGRVDNKTWGMTGYQASYTYNAGGYLTVVTGTPTSGTAADITAQTLRHEILGINDQGQITSYRTGNSAATYVTTHKSVDPSSGRLLGQTATTAGQTSGNVVNQSYTYDSLSNLLTRNDLSEGVGTAGVGTQESFQYDNLNRLTLSSFYGGAITPAQQVQVMYDARGNISYKSDVGRYWYDTARPNRLTNITLETAPGATISHTGSRALSYAFDDYLPSARVGTNGITSGNGNLMYTVSQDTAQGKHSARWESYTSFNMINDIKFGSVGGSVVAPSTNPEATTLAGTPVEKSLAFLYGPEHQRIKQVATGGQNSGVQPGTTWYLNGEDSLGLTYEKELKTTAAGVAITEHKHYLQAGGITFAMHTMRHATSGGSIANPQLPTGIDAPTAYSSSYLHHDQLGSIIAISNTAGTVVERLAYDPWGKRRFITGAADTLDAITGVNIDRGFTMHEHIDEMGIINMNGRIYDPLIGRFMSADPIIQAPYNLKSFNRYSYVWNNPLKMWDPTGFDALTNPGGNGGGGILDIPTPEQDPANCPSGCTITLPNSVTGEPVTIITGCKFNCTTYYGMTDGKHDGSSYDVTVVRSPCDSGCSGARGSGTSSGNPVPQPNPVTASVVPINVVSGSAQGQKPQTQGVPANSKLPALLRLPAMPDWSKGQKTQIGGIVVPSQVATNPWSLAAAVGFGFAYNYLKGKDVNNDAALSVGSNSRALARNITKETGEVKEKGQDAHHIVAANKGRAMPAKMILDSVGMSIDSVFNGIFLDSSFHRRMHTNAYYDAVNDRLEGASTYPEVAFRLSLIKASIKLGYFPE
jgi:RHS repeat-associated protein